MRQALLCLSTFILVACTQPLETPVPTDLAQLASIKPSVEKLPLEERDLFAEYLARRLAASAFASMDGRVESPIPNGMTIGKAISEQRQFRVAQAARAEERRVAEAKALEEKKKAEAERKRIQQEMAAALSIELTGVAIKPEMVGDMKLGDMFNTEFQFTNRSPKAIAGVKWRALFRDSFGDGIKGVRFKLEQPIAPGANATETFGTKLNPFMPDDKRLAEFDASGGRDKVEIIPELILFADGTKLEVPSE